MKSGFRIFVVLCVVSGFLYPQKKVAKNPARTRLSQQIGVHLGYFDRDFSTLHSTVTTAAMGYIYPAFFLKQPLTLLAYAGVSSVVFSSPAEVLRGEELKSDYAFFYRAGLNYPLWIFYLQAEVINYKVDGKIIESKPDSVIFIHHNQYSLFEYPIRTGFSLNLGKNLKVSAGAVKSFFYGTFEKESTFRRGDYSHSLKIPSRSFMDQLPEAWEGTIQVYITKKLNIQIRYLKLMEGGFGAELALWSRLT